MRRTETTTWTPSLSSRSRSPVTCVRATRGARGPQPEFLHEHVRGGREEHAQLIGPEATAARASDLESVVQFLDPILDVAACAVDPLVDEPRRLPQIRDHKARVVAGLTAGEADDFGFDHDAALVGPGPGGIARLGVDVCGLPARLALRSGPRPWRARRTASTPRFPPWRRRNRGRARRRAGRGSPASQTRHRGEPAIGPWEMRGATNQEPFTRSSRESTRCLWRNDVSATTRQVSVGEQLESRAELTRGRARSAGRASNRT